MTRSLPIICALFTGFACVPEEEAREVGTTQAELRAFADNFVLDGPAAEREPRLVMDALHSLYTCYCDEDAVSHICVTSTTQAESACAGRLKFDNCGQVYVGDTGYSCDPMPGDPGMPPRRSVSMF